MAPPEVRSRLSVFVSLRAVMRKARHGEGCARMFVFKLIVGVAFNVAIFGGSLFLPAGTLDWWRAWVFLGWSSWARTITETRGFMKALVDAQRDRVLGFTMLGPEAREVMAVVQKQATFPPDLDEVYTGVMPPVRHNAMTKQARKTNHVERFNSTLRQRVSRLVRDTLSCSKNLAHHGGVIEFYICYDNRAKAAVLPVWHYLCRRAYHA
jgi:IS1 transposase/Pyridine nucleotide-disulphide oxidoreductase, dimerisation domain